MNFLRGENSKRTSNPFFLPGRVFSYPQPADNRRKPAPAVGGVLMGGVSIYKEIEKILRVGADTNT